MRKMRARFEPMSAYEEERAVHYCEFCGEGIYSGEVAHDLIESMVCDTCIKDHAEEEFEHYEVENVVGLTCLDCGYPLEEGERAARVNNETFCHECYTDSMRTEFSVEV